jgi:hypothetical protein
MRRTVSDRMRSDLDVAPHVVALGVLGHATPKLLKTYMPSVNLAEVRRALEAWSRHLDGILAGEATSTKVLPHHPKARA